MGKLIVFLLATALNSLLLVAAVEEPSESTDDQKAEIRRLVDDTRKLSTQAKDGIVLNDLFKDIQDLNQRAVDLISNLPKKVSQCETNLVIKMAATGVGSHEVLTLLFADDQLKVMNGRLSLSLAFLEHLAQLLLDESTLKDSDVGPHLAALVFGAKSAASIVKQAGEAAKQAADSIEKEEAVPVENTTKDNTDSEEAKTHARRASVLLDRDGFRFFHYDSSPVISKRQAIGTVWSFVRRASQLGNGGQATWRNSKSQHTFSVDGPGDTVIVVVVVKA